MPKKRAIVTGWYGHKNLGDESYKLTFPKIFSDEYDLQFSDSYSLSNSYDAVFLGGGDIFSPIFTDPLIGLNKPCYAASITLPDEPCEALLKQMKWIAVRDKRSYNKISDLPNVFYCPDFAFLLDGNSYQGRENLQKLFEDEKRDLYEHKVAVILNSHLIAKPSDETRKHVIFENFVFKLAEICDNTNASFVFLPFSTHMPWDDRVSSGMVASRCKFWKKNLVIYNCLGVQDTLDLISSVDVVISTRLHSSIFSCSTQTPFIDVTHNHKNASLLEDTGLEELSIHYWECNFKEFKHKLNNLIEEHTAIKSTLKQVVNQQRKLIDCFNENIHRLQ